MPEEQKDEQTQLNNNAQRKAVNRMFSDATLSQTPDRSDSITWPLTH